MTTFALLDPASDAPIRDYELSSLESLSTSLLEVSVLAHLPNVAISSPDDWHPENLLALVQSLRLNLSTKVAARARLAQENQPVVQEEKLESELTSADRAAIAQSGQRMIPAENGQYRIVFAAPQPLDVPTGMNSEEQDLSTLLDQFESFVLQGQEQHALLRNLAVELPGAEPAPQE